MFSAHNNHFHINLLPSFGLKLIKFSYFFIALFLLSCGDTKTEKTTENKKAAEQIEDTVATDISTKTILCFGDSITAGYGLDDTDDAYPAVLQEKIDSLGLEYTVINSGVSGETTAGGKSRIDWVIKQNMDIFLLELGANDGLRGVALSETRANLQAIIDIVREKSPETTIVLAGMELPPNMGQDYTKGFRQLYADLAEKNNLAFIPFILKDVGGVAALNQSDGIHPTVEGHKIVANTVWETLRPLLKS
ncbi:arylesterase [Marixanthomonas ophiurae]|uniref:Arylesterase n=1 Tax=Marixanthomonas ophiurae TaxID=387659 RepID=A0A3E1Q8W6_9FLAO|nr:arylesterase [Marixanthomonas ophiurae]RFN58568.1 arylesterase [Marixanthomonas ophiurae]